MFIKSFRCVTRILLFVCFSFVCTPIIAELDSNWPRWRGPRDNGSKETGSYPVTWSADNVLWKAPLPGKGCSTPIVWNHRIYLTAPATDVDSVLAFDWVGESAMADKVWQGRSWKTSKWIGQQPITGHGWTRRVCLFQERHTCGGRVRWQSAVANESSRSFWTGHIVLGSRNVSRSDERVRRHGQDAPRRIVACRV